MRTGTEEGESLRHLLNALPDGAAGIAFDPGNMIIHGFSPSDALPQLSDSILYIVARDAVRDLAIGRGLEVPLGRGSVDFPEVVGNLGEAGYRGYYCVDRQPSPHVVNEISDAVSYLRNM